MNTLGTVQLLLRCYRPPRVSMVQNRLDPLLTSLGRFSTNLAACLTHEREYHGGQIVSILGTLVMWRSEETKTSASIGDVPRSRGKRGGIAFRLALPKLSRRTDPRFPSSRQTSGALR